MALSKKPGIYAFVCTDHDHIPTHFQGAELGVKGRHTRGVRTSVAKQFDRSTEYRYGQIYSGNIRELL